MDKLTNEQIKELFTPVKPVTDERIYYFELLRKQYYELAGTLYNTIQDPYLFNLTLQHLQISFLLASNGLKVDEYRVLTEDQRLELMLKREPYQEDI